MNPSFVGVSVHIVCTLPFRIAALKSHLNSPRNRIVPSIVFIIIAVLVVVVVLLLFPILRSHLDLAILIALRGSLLV